MPLPWLASLVYSPERSDVVVTCETEDGKKARFPVHSCVICIQSEPFRTMLKPKSFSEAITGKIKISGFTPRVVDYFLRFLYLNTIPEAILFEHLLELLHIGHFYEVDDLVNRCCSRLVKAMSIDTVCVVYESANLRQLTKLMNRCKRYISEHFQIILENDLHYSLQMSSLKMFIDLYINQNNPPYTKNKLELIVVKPLKRWRIWNSYTSGVTVDDLDEYWQGLTLLDTHNESPFIMKTDVQPSTKIIPWVYELCLSSYLSDMEVMVEDNDTTRFPAHSLVLNAHSEVFLDEWNQRRDKNDKLPFIMKTDNPRLVEYFLRFLYTRFFPERISGRNLLDLIILAHQYQVNDLILKCKSSLAKRLTTQNSCHVLAKTSGLTKDLETSCLDKIVQDLESILNNNLHFVLDQAMLIKVLRAAEACDLQRNPCLKEWAVWHCIKFGLDLKEVDSFSFVKAVALAVEGPPERTVDCGVLSGPERLILRAKRTSQSSDLPPLPDNSPTLPNFVNNFS